MSNPKTNHALLFLGMLAVVLFFGTGFANVATDGHSLRELERDVYKDLSLANDNESRARESAEALKAAIRLLGNISSPIKVRGGSMTVFTTDLNKWRNGDGSPAHPYCAEVDHADNVRLDGTKVSGITLPWTIQLHGTIPVQYHPYNQFDPSPRGITLSGSQNDCNGHAGHNSVTLSYFGTDAGFYSDSLKPTGNKADSKRFSDGSQHCLGNPQASGEGDREVCERMREIDSTLGVTPVIQKPCLDGDCDFDIGDPIP